MWRATTQSPLFVQEWAQIPTCTAINGGRLFEVQCYLSSRLPDDLGEVAILLTGLTDTVRRVVVEVVLTVVGSLAVPALHGLHHLGFCCSGRACPVQIAAASFWHSRDLVNKESILEEKKYNCSAKPQYFIH